MIKVETPYCELTLPEEFAGNVEYRVVSEDPYTVEFTAKDGTKLFSLLFNGETENLIGTIVGEDENTVIYAEFAELDETDSKYMEYGQYQSGINTIIEHLIEDFDLLANEAIKEEDNSVFAIETSVTKLYYPSKWENVVTVKTTEETVEFSYQGEKMFDLIFAECDGFLLGKYKDVPIYVVSYEWDEEKYTEEEAWNLRAMENDINVIIQYLTEDENFVIAN